MFQCSLCSDNFAQWRPDLPLDLDAVRPTKARKMMFCKPCAEFCRRWNFTIDFQSDFAVRNEDVAVFAKTKIHASWLVWDINRSRKVANRRSRRVRLVKIEKRRQIRDNARMSRTRKLFKLLSLNKVLDMCTKLGKV